jgi:hypothetical protein
VADFINASGIAAFQLQPVDENTVALWLTDPKGKESAFLINPEILNAMLLPLLGLAIQWAGKPALEIGKLVGPLHAIPATQIDIAKGRSAEECALRVFVGSVEITFLVPLSAVLEATGELIRKIEPTSPPRTH